MFNLNQGDRKANPRSVQRIALGGSSQEIVTREASAHGWGDICRPSGTRALSALIELSGISKSFAGVRVLQDVSFDVRAGEVHALLGENGAGKSTLIKIIAGVHRARRAATIAGRTAQAVTLRVAARGAARAGIATVYQELLLFPELTVAENIFLGHAPTHALGRARLAARCARAARELLDSLESHDLDVDDRVGTLSVANRQRVEIAKALSQDARVLIMDEPTAALAEADVRGCCRSCAACATRGVGIVYVSHRCRRSSRSPTASPCCATAPRSAPRPIGEVDERELVSMMVGRADRPAVPQAERPRSARRAGAAQARLRPAWCATSR